MKLWLLRPADKYQNDIDVPGNPWDPWYDKCFGFVIAAETEAKARELTVAAHPGDEVKYEYDYDKMVESSVFNPWLDPNYSTCVELTNDVEEGVIIRDFARA